MTDVIKAIVKLPPKNRQSFAPKNNNSDNLPSPQPQPKEPLHYDSYLVSDRLYMQVPSAIVEFDILDLLQTCHPQDIHLTSQPFPELSSGYITFPNKDQADLAFTLFNGANFSNGMRLLLYINPLTNERDPEPEAAADILQVQNLPTDSTNKSLYDLFRSFGPMALCKVVVEQGTVDYHGAALIQYYHTDDADHAVSFMNNRRIQENIITVFPFVSSKQHRLNVEMDIQHGDHSTNNAKQGNEPIPIDYTNLYIKNLDLNAKSSDLFKHFRKYGHIISARVMKNARTNQSKGFGFVSFINADEADRARNGMNGRYILSKAVQVAFHEPKKNRNEKSSGSNGDDTSQQQPQLDTNDDTPITRRPLLPPSNISTDNYKSNGVHLSHMAASYSPPTLQQTNHSLQSPIPQHHHHRSHHQAQQHQLTYHYHQPSPSSSLAYQQSNQQQYLSSYTLNEDSPSHRSTLASKKSPSFVKHGQLTTSSPDHGSSISDHNPTLHGYHSPRTNDYNGNVYSTGSNDKKGTIHTMDYDHSYSSRKQHFGTGLLNNTNTNTNTNTTPPSLSSLASGASIQAAPSRSHHTTTTATVAYKTTARGGPSMRRRGSIESISSVMTETSTNAQRQRLTNAIHQCISKDDMVADQMDDIVDMLLTLKKKERSLCLFNPDFLKAKVQQAKIALETFDGDDDENDHPVAISAPPPPPPLSQAPTTATTTTKEISNRPVNDNSSSSSISGSTTTGKRNSSSTTSPSSKPTPSSPPSTEDMNAFLTSLEGLAMHEKKQKLGDWLFPLVKATGIKHAPKITIRLLDTVPLYELAHLMHVESSLRLKIDQVMTGDPPSTVV